MEGTSESVAKVIVNNRILVYQPADEVIGKRHMN